MQTQTASFGQWLKARRKELDLTRAQLAQRIGYADVTLEKIERDQRRPSKQIAELLAQALSIPDDARAEFIRLARAGEVPLPDGQTARPRTSAPPTNLPAPLTSFIDRTRELAAVQQRLLQPDVHLLTLVGPPGIGKTRLSIQVGQTLLDHFADGAWFVALAPITDPNLVLPTIAQIFEIAEGASPLLERLQAHLRMRQTLLIVDNFEHVLDPAPQLADLLKACAGLKVLATSRTPLRVYGEQEYRMPGLSLPPKGARLSSQQLAAFDAIKLFVARVRAFQPDFQLDANNAQAVVDICARMDGMPLAIELAASRLRRFTVQQLRDALHAAPLQTLIATVSDVEPRQRTLRAAIQWSYDLLTPPERAAFAKLGVFAGGASTEAALTVCELGDDAIVHDLADQNLLKRDAESRWTMLEMIREFALDTLAQMPNDALERTQQRHAEYFARLLKPGSDEAWRIIDVEQHNARAALHWLLDLKHPLTGELAQFMSGYFFHAGLHSESRRMLLEVLSADIEMEPLIRSDLLATASINAWAQHDFEEALRYAHAAVAISRAVNSQPQTAENLIAFANLYIVMDDCAQAKQVALEALQIGRTIQNLDAIVGALDQLGEAELILGNVVEASTYFEEAYALCRNPDFRQHVYIGLACMGMGKIALNRRDYDPALRFLHEALERSKYPAQNLEILDVLAGVIGTMPRRTTADVQRAAKIWGAAEALNEKMGLVAAPGDRRRTDALIAEARSRINSKTFAAAWAEGRELSLDEAIELAME